jgi:hypothetical protein
MSSSRCRALCVLFAAALLVVGTSAASQAPGVVSEAVLEDFSDVVTPADLGFDDFAGNSGTINKDGLPYGTAQLARGADGRPALRFAWDFAIGPDREAFTGLFYSLFGLTDTLATFDGQNVQSIAFPEHSLDLDRIDGVLAEPGGPRSFRRLCASLVYQGAQTLGLRVELKDVDGSGRFTRFQVVRAAAPQTFCWNFRDPLEYRVIGTRDLDLGRAKVMSLVIERENVADRVANPDSGELELRRLWFVPDRPALEPHGDAELLDLLERRSCQYFLDWASRKQASLGLPQDRSTFGDLLTVGGAGFALPGYVVCAERGWIPRGKAVARVLSVLRILADEAAFGPERVGRIGHRGFLYHFLGVDARRKLSFDVRATPEDESLNTVELSTIDTGLALMGVLAAQSYFRGDDPQEAEIRALAQEIYDRVDWPFMLEPGTQLFYLGWKPNERHGPPAFDIPDAAGEGAYSGTPGAPATLDFYTDEAFIVTLLAVGSTTHPVPVEVHCAWQRVRGPHGLVRTFPGSLFTYQFLRAFLDTRPLRLPACPGERPVDWYANSRTAIRAVIEYTERNPRGFRTYGHDAWGISAAEGPDDRYRAYGAPPVALAPAPEEDGTVTYYAMLSAVSFGADLRARAVRALRRAWQRGDWSLRFALPDAFHDEIAQAALDCAGGCLRADGPWAQRALFAIDQGPMLLHLENARSGLVWSLIAANANIQRALERLRSGT